MAWGGRAAVLALLAAAALVTACTDGGDDVVAGDEEAISHPAGDQLVLDVQPIPGFPLADLRLQPVPRATLLGNGRMIVEGAQIAIFPPPALPPLFEVQLTGEGVQTILVAAREAGLLSSADDYGSPPIADAATTVITVQASGETFVHEIYALSDLPDGAGLTERQRALRRQVSELVAALPAPEELVGPDQVSDPEPYRAEAVAFHALPVAEGSPALPDGVEPQVVDWPLPGVPLDPAQDCQLVSGSQAGELLEVLGQASTITRYRQGGELLTIEVRPLLPHEEACADVTL